MRTLFASAPEHVHYIQNCSRQEVVKFSIEIMPNSDLLVAGSIHQGRERFSDISHGRQCSFMSFSALLFAHTLPIEQWPHATY